MINLTEYDAELEKRFHEGCIDGLQQQRIKRVMDVIHEEYRTRKERRRKRIEKAICMALVYAATTAIFYMMIINSWPGVKH